MDEKFLLQCNDYQARLKEVFYNLKEKKEFSDVTLACQDGHIPAHQVILSYNSRVLHNVLKSHQHPQPFLYLMGINMKTLNLLLDFIYHGEVEVMSEDLNKFLAAAEELQVQGLSGISKTKNICNDVQKQDTNFTVKEEPNFVDNFCEDSPTFDLDTITNDYAGEINMNPRKKNYSIKKCTQKVVKKNKRPKLQRNPVWDYFTKEDNKSTCNQCGSSLLGYNTTSLINHLRYKHIEVHMEYREKFEIALREKKTCIEAVVIHENTMNNVESDDIEDITQNSNLLEDHMEERHYEVLNVEKTPCKTSRKQGRLSYNPVHEFYQRVDENSQCNTCQFILMGHNPNSLKKHLESHPEQFLQFSEMFHLAWKEKLNKKKEKEFNMKTIPIQSERTILNNFFGHEMEDETATDPFQCGDKEIENETATATNPFQCGDDEIENEIEKETNEEDRILFCDQCEYETRWHGALKKHIESKHAGVTYECDICYKKFNLVSSMNYHIRSEHEGRRYHCEICSKEFKCMSHLTQHQRAIHEGVKYPCPHCEYQATQNYNLSKHILKVHGISTNSEILKIEAQQ